MNRARCYIGRSWLIGLMQWLLVAAIAGGLGLDPALMSKIEQQFGIEARQRVQSWDDLVRDNQTLSVQQKLELVNQFFNELGFVSDLEHWGKEDYWATPLEFLTSSAGDCEDFSLAKYFTLRELGVPIENMTLTYVKAVKLNQAHMVLSYYASPGSEPQILDNLVSEIKPASQRRDLVPVYSFNGDSLWLAKERGRGQRVGGADRVGLWKDLTERMQESGLARLNK